MYIEYEYIYIHTHLRIHFQFVELLHHFLREMSLLKDSNRLFKLCLGQIHCSDGWDRTAQAKREIERKCLKNSWMPKWCEIAKPSVFSVNVSNNFKIWILLRSILPKLCSQVAKTTRVRHTWCFLLSNWHFKWSRICDTQSMAVLIYSVWAWFGLQCKNGH